MKKKINSKQKGKRGELELAHYLTDKGYVSRRGQQFAGGTESPDIVSTFPYHIECKRTETFNLYKSLEQATNDANGKKIPIVVHRKSRKPWVVCLTLDDFLSIASNPALEPQPATFEPQPISGVDLDTKPR
jgi:Holliday junction resolvase